MRKKTILIVVLTVLLVLVGIMAVRLMKGVRYAGMPQFLPRVEVRLPDRMLAVDFDSIYDINDKKIDRTTLLVWIDSTHCMPCSVEYLYDYELLNKKLKTTISDSLQVIAVLSPKFSELEALKYKLKREHFDFPVFIDESNKFSVLNPFFINENGEVTICTDKEGIYGLCKLDCLYNNEDESTTQMFIHNLSLLHKYNYEGVLEEVNRIRSSY